MFQHYLVHFLLPLHELGDGWSNVRRSLLVKLRSIALIQKRNILIKIRVATYRSLLELTVSLI
jgi:hypothetical protein